MTARTVLTDDQLLPLTCTRAGTCCHGKSIAVNPWELAVLASVHHMGIRELRDTHTSDGGTRLRMNGDHRWRDRPACTFYNESTGCTVHSGRPLACRLYPLGRERQADQVRYIHDGTIFPCLDGCLDVTELPSQSVGNYLKNQDARAGELAQDAYLEVMQDLAEGAFVLLFDTPLWKSDPTMMGTWRRIGLLRGEERARRLGKMWIDLLTLPTGDIFDPEPFAVAHRTVIQERAQQTFGALSDIDSVRQGCETMLLLACHLGSSLGAEPHDLVTTWCASAKANGAPD